jgi:hypothetical protein
MVKAGKTISKIKKVLIINLKNIFLKNIFLNGIIIFLNFSKKLSKNK